MIPVLSYHKITEYTFYDFSPTSGRNYGKDLNTIDFCTPSSGHLQWSSSGGHNTDTDNMKKDIRKTSSNLGNMVFH